MGLSAKDLAWQAGDAEQTARALSLMGDAILIAIVIILFLVVVAVR